MRAYLAFLRDNAPFLAAGILLALLSSFGLTFYLAPFSGEIRAAYGLGHGAWGAIYAAATLASGLGMLWAGALCDRFRARTLATVALLALAAATLALALQPPLWALPGVIFALRLLGQGMVVQTMLVAISRWFVGTRGRALAVAHLGFSVGEIALPLAVVALKPVVDWRWLLAAGAGIILAALPVLRHLLRLERTPQSLAAVGDSAGLGGRHWTRAQALRHPLFWGLVPAMLAPGMFSGMVFFHQVHIVEVAGWSHLGFLALMPAYTAGAMLGMFGGGWAVDRYGARRLMGGFLVPLALACLVFPLVGPLAAVAVPLALMGVTNGAQATVPAAFWAEVWGTRHLGAVRAAVGAVMVAATAAGPALAGVLIDAGFPLRAQMPWYGVATALACGMAAAGVARHGRGEGPGPGRPSTPAQIDVAGP
jgi:MFS family permease